MLKDATATALYGSKGANGVVIITTKRSSQDGKFINWSSNVDFSSPAVKGYARPSWSHNHSVAVGSMKNKTGYYLNAYFRDNNYVLPGTGSMWGGLRASFETRANNVVWFGLNSQVAVGNNNGAATGAWFGNESLTMKMRDPEADVTGWANDYDDDALEFRAVNSVWLKLNFFKGFSFKFDLGTDFQSQARNFWWGNGTPFGLSVNGAASQLRNMMFAYNASGVFEYDRTFADAHHLKVSAGAQAIGNMNIFNNMNGSGYANHSLRAKSINFMASKAIIHRYDLQQFAVGAFATASYDFKGMAGVDVAFRADTTPKFGDWNLYPSASAFWDVRKSFFADAETVSSLRINGGYGESGRDYTFPYDFFGNYTAGPYEQIEDVAYPFYDGRAYIHSKEWNISLTFGMFDDRLSVTAGYYQRKTTDRLSMFTIGEHLVDIKEVTDDSDGEEPAPDAPADPGEGDGPETIEYRYWAYKDRQQVSTQESEVANKGVEFSVTAIPVQTKDWTWSINVNGAYNINNIAKLAVEDQGGMAVGSFSVASDENDGAQVVSPLIATRNIEDNPVSSIVDADGNVLGNPTPKYYGGLGTTLRWKDLTLDILADGATGFNILNLNEMYKAGETAVSSKYVEKGDFFRLARVSLSYNIPVKSIKWMQSFKVFATASNLAVVSDYSGWSPDVNSYAASNFRLGMDYGSCPAAKSFVLGLSIKF